LFIPRLRLWTVIPLALAATHASAQPVAVPLVNPSFDDVDLVGTTGQSVLPIVAGWTETGPSTEITDPNFGTFDGKLDTGVFVNTEVDLDGPGGDPAIAGPIPNVHGPNNQAAFLIANLNASTEVTLSQPTAAVFTEGHQYELTVALGQSFLSSLSEDASNPALFELAIGYFDGADVFQSVAATLVSNEQLATRTGFDQAPLVDFAATTGVLGSTDAALGESVAIRFRAADGLGGGWNLDNVRLTNIPEPGTAALLVPCLLALLRRSGFRNTASG
jgi:hypothetical protein